MCFMLYAGTTRPLARSAWSRESRDISVSSLNEQELPVRSHFTLPEVQNLGSTSGCGCDFPHLTRIGGDWAGHLSVGQDGDPEADASEQFNRQRLVDLLRRSGEHLIELYGVWQGDGSDVAAAKMFRQDIPLIRILDPDFRFKEKVFYTAME